MRVDPLYNDAIDHFGVSASQVADLLNPSLYDHLWPDDNIPVSLAWLAEVILTTAYAAKANRSTDLATFLAARDLSSPVHSTVGPQGCSVPPSAPGPDSRTGPVIRAVTRFRSLHHPLPDYRRICPPESSLS